MIHIARKPTIVTSQKTIFFGANALVLLNGATYDSPPHAGGGGVALADAATQTIKASVDMPDGVKRVRSITIYVEDNTAGNVRMNYDYVVYKLDNNTVTVGVSGSVVKTESGKLTGSNTTKSFTYPQAQIDDINANLGTRNKLDLSIYRSGSDVADTLVNSLWIQGVLVQLQ